MPKPKKLKTKKVSKICFDAIPSIDRKGDLISTCICGKCPERKIVSEDKLWSFVHYCYQHPTERFWQALRNWSGYWFIFGGTKEISITEAHKLGLQDTFFKE